MGAVIIDFDADGVLAGKGPEIEPVVSGCDRTLTGEAREGRETKAMSADKPVADQGKRVLQRLKAELGDDIFTSWFGRIEFDEADRTSVYLSVPTPFLKSWILAHYRDRLLTLWQEERPGTLRVEIRVRGTIRTKPSPRGD